MKRDYIFVCFLAAMSVVSGVLMSKASWVGRVGMTLFYREYNLLKIWWQGAIAVFLFLLLLYFLHLRIYRHFHTRVSRLLSALFLLVAAGGAYLTYDDFTHDFSHHLLGKRFHAGFYLVWVDWVVMCLFFLFRKRYFAGAVEPLRRKRTANKNAGKVQEQISVP